jgi:hypothetical protein
MKDLYRFRIDAFKPETIPMVRLAEYMAELAKLLGTTERVHFKRLERGSAVLVAEVEEVAVPKVRERLVRVDPRGNGDDAGEQFRRLNVMLAEDNAVGRLRRGTATILDFPGRKAPPVRIGPVNQDSTVQGQLVRIGGRDKTSHGLIVDAGGRPWKIVTTREEARALAQMIYGPEIRVAGQGRWFRSDTGRWELDELRLQSWEPLNAETLRESIDRLRGVEWQGDPDPFAALKRIRGDDGVH